MAFCLRDQQVQNVSFDTEALTQINSIFEERFKQLQIELSEKLQPACFMTYIIRFDNKGYRVFSLGELLKYFNQAQDVERVVFAIESADAISSSRNTGAFLELFLDAKDPNRCMLTSTSDNKDWAEASFAAVNELLAKNKNKNYFARNPWTGLFLQLFGLIIVFILSLWLSYKMPSSYKGDSLFIVTFLFGLLVFSNIWSYLNPVLLSFVAKIFPNIDFIRPKKAKIHWLTQAIIGSSTFAVIVFFLDKAFAYISKFLSAFFNGFIS